MVVTVPQTESVHSTTYTKPPPSKLRSTETAKSEVAPAGPIQRMIDVVVWARPVVAPSAEREGAAEVRNMNIQLNAKHGRVANAICNTSATQTPVPKPPSNFARELITGNKA